MNSCCHSCPKAAHLNEVSSLPYKFRDGKQHFEKNVNSRMPKRCFYSAAQMGENFTPLHPPSAKKKKKNIYRERKCHIGLNATLQLSSWVMFLQPFVEYLLPLSSCLQQDAKTAYKDLAQGPCLGWGGRVGQVLCTVGPCGFFYNPSTQCSHMYRMSRSQAGFCI